MTSTMQNTEASYSFTTDIPNHTTAAAIEEGRRIAKDETIQGYTSIDDLKAAFEI